MPKRPVGEEYPPSLVLSPSRSPAVVQRLGAAEGRTRWDTQLEQGRDLPLQVSPGGQWEAWTSHHLLRAGQTLSMFGWIAGIAFAQISVEGEKVPSQALILHLIWHLLKTKDILPWTLALTLICFVARYPLSFIGLFQVGTKGPRSLPDPILVLSVCAILVCTGFTETEIWIFSVIYSFS